MATNNKVLEKFKFQDLPDVPDNQKVTATKFNNIVDFQNSPVQQIAGSLNDTNIIINGTRNYGTTIVVAGATRTITANASGHLQGNNIKQRYQFNVDCTLTLVAFDTVGNNTGTTSPIPSGTYDFQFISNRNGVNLNIPQNTEAQDISDKLDKVDPAAQEVTSDVEFLGNVLADKLAADVATQLNTGDFGGAVAIGSGYGGIATAPTDGMIVEGNSGFGTNDPQRKVDIRGDLQILSSSGNLGIRIVVPTGNEGFLIFGDPVDNSRGGFAYNNTTDTLSIDTNNAERVTIDSFGDTGFGIILPVAKVDINQSRAAGAIPALKLRQADLSEEMVSLEATIGIGNPIEAIGAKSFTQTHFMKGFVVGLGIKYIPLGDLA